MKFIPKILLAFFICFQTNIAFSQDKTSNFKEGVIRYKIEMDGAAEYSFFVENSYINLYFKDENVNMDISIMGGMANFQFIHDIQAGLSTLLMDVPAFSEKTAIKLEKDSDLFKELRTEKTTNQAPVQPANTQYFKNKKKKIAKYPCYKAEIPINDGSGDKMIVYLTDKLRPSAIASLEKTMGPMDGFPMSFEINIDGSVLKITAVEVSKKTLEDEMFEIPESYSQKSLEEFKNDIQQKMGGGDSKTAIGL